MITDYCVCHQTSAFIMKTPGVFVCAYCKLSSRFPDIRVRTPNGHRLLSTILTGVADSISSPEVKISMSISIGDDGSVKPPPIRPGGERYLLHHIHTGEREYIIGIDLPPGIDANKFTPWSSPVVIDHNLDAVGDNHGGNGHDRQI